MQVEKKGNETDKGGWRDSIKTGGKERGKKDEKKEKEKILFKSV